MKTSAQAVNKNPEPLDPTYEDPDAALGHNLQTSFLQNMEVRTEDNVAYSTQLQVLENKEVHVQDNLAYSAISTIS